MTSLGKDSPPIWFRTLILAMLITLGFMAYGASKAKGDTVCKTTCTTDGWGNPVCKTVCQEL